MSKVKTNRNRSKYSMWYVSPPPRSVESASSARTHALKSEACRMLTSQLRHMNSPQMMANLLWETLGLRWWE